MYHSAIFYPGPVQHDEKPAEGALVPGSFVSLSTLKTRRPLKELIVSSWEDLHRQGKEELQSFTRASKYFCVHSSVNLQTLSCDSFAGVLVPSPPKTIQSAPNLQAFWHLTFNDYLLYIICLTPLSCKTVFDLIYPFWLMYLPKSIDAFLDLSRFV